MTEYKNRCVIWGTPAEVSPLLIERLPNCDWQNVYGKSLEIDSPRVGGKYRISNSTGTNDLHHDVKARLTTLLINERNLGVESPWVDSEMIEEAKNARPLSVDERADRLLLYFESMSYRIGSGYKYYPQDNCKYPMLAWSESIDVDEYEYLLNYLIGQDWITSKFEDLFIIITITMKGYMRIAEIKNVIKKSSQAFVAMWFDESMNSVYDEAIAPAVREAGYEPFRVDRKEHSNSIYDEIIGEIRRSRFLIADFTFRKDDVRGGVYYEAGFAHGLNIPVIFSCRKDCIEDLHFDTRQYNHIVWESEVDLKDALIKRIRAAIGEGPHASGEKKRVNP